MGIQGNILPKMVQIKMLEAAKADLKSSELTSVTSTSPSVVPDVRRVRTNPQRSSRSSGLTVFLFLLLGVSFMATVKRLCDYKELNLRLRQDLAIEKQKDYLLKQAVRAAVPEEQFAILSNIPNLDTEVPEEEVPGWFSMVHLRFLWTSPRLYICKDMVAFTRQLVVEIYRKEEVQIRDEED